MHEDNLKVVISIDFKKYRIRIHKASLRLIGNPKYIQFLINPQLGAFVIRSLDLDLPGDQAHRINQQCFESDNSVEVYSHPFVTELRSVESGLDDGTTYRFQGKAIPKQRIAVFYLKEKTRVDIEAREAE